MLLVLGVGGCAVARAPTVQGDDLVSRAIRARGGLAGGVRREVDAKVHAGVPGQWEWGMTSVPPDGLRWDLHTFGEDQSYVFRGGKARYYLGTAELPVPPDVVEGLRSQARWMAVSMLDVLVDAQRVAWGEIESAGLPAGASAGIEVQFRDGGAPYRLYFDADLLIVAIEGDLEIPTIGAGRVRARFADHRRVGGVLLPHRSDYVMNGEPLVEESVRGMWRGAKLAGAPPA